MERLVDLTAPWQKKFDKSFKKDSLGAGKLLTDFKSTLWWLGTGRDSSDTELYSVATGHLALDRLRGVLDHAFRVPESKSSVKESEVSRIWQLGTEEDRCQKGTYYLCNLRRRNESYRTIGQARFS